MIKIQPLSRSYWGPALSWQHSSLCVLGAGSSTRGRRHFYAHRRAGQGQRWLWLQGWPQRVHFRAKLAPPVLLRILTLMNSGFKLNKTKKARNKTKQNSKSTRHALPKVPLRFFFPSYADKTLLVNSAAKLEEGKVLLHCFCKSSLEGRFWQWIISSWKQLAQTCTSEEPASQAPKKGLRYGTSSWADATCSAYERVM